jgi:hypothetical protein
MPVNPYRSPATEITEVRATKSAEQSELLGRVAAISVSRLARLACSERSLVRQSYLLSNNALSGMRFEAGRFQAQWRVDQTTIRLSRDQQLIDQIPLDTLAAKAA